jgi:hypothetical protein
MSLWSGTGRRTFVLSIRDNDGDTGTASQTLTTGLKLFMRLYTGNPNAAQTSAAFFLCLFKPTIQVSMYVFEGNYF